MARLISGVANDMAQRLMERVKHLRETLGLSQEAFAERAGLKYKHYQAVEAGRKRNIQFSTLIKLAKACGLEPWELLNFDTEPSALAEPETAYTAPKTPKKQASAKPRRRTD